MFKPGIFASNPLDSEAKGEAMEEDKIPETIVVSEYGMMRRLVPDDHGGFTLFKMSAQWEWRDSIGLDSAKNIIKDGEKVYQLISKGA